MTDIISLECIAEAEPGAISPDVYRGALIKALTAIKELVAERDRLLLEADPELPTIAYMTGAHDWKVRAEKVEADLAAARTALRDADRWAAMAGWKRRNSPRHRSGA